MVITGGKRLTEKGVYQKEAARRLAIPKWILANWMAASYPIEIWSRLTEAPIKVGDMICEIGETGRGKGSFRYDRQAGWRLSPSFDLLPDVGRNGEHVLFFDLGGYSPDVRPSRNLGVRGASGTPKG